MCRESRKAVQIHHIDEDPSNNDARNLAALCFDCHRETQISGGFDRKLDAEQVALYRDDWHQTVAAQRASMSERADPSGETIDPSRDVNLLTSLIEYHKEQGNNADLARLYARIGNEELRDKYVELAIENSDNPREVLFNRRLQGRLDEVPSDIVETVLAEIAETDWTAHAWLLLDLGRDVEAAAVTLRQLMEDGVGESNWFMTAWYMKHLVPVISHRLFILALREAVENDDLLWQLRALQELGWDTEVKAFLLSHSSEVEQLDDPHLLRELAAARGDIDSYREQELRYVRELDSAFEELPTVAQDHAESKEDQGTDDVEAESDP